MANADVGRPRFYCDHINYLMSRGVAQNGNFDVVTPSGALAIQTGSEAELFDMNPLNQVNFDTSGNTSSHVLVNIDTAGAFQKSFVAILNHNMKTADCRVVVKGSDTESEVNAVDMSGATSMANPVHVVNANAISSSTITPDSDGSTIVTFDESSLRYWGLQFEGATSFDATTDLSIGCILIGEVYSMPVSPSLELTRSITFDQVKVLESAGGRRFANMSTSGKEVSATSKAPFATSIYQSSTHGGRISYDLHFSHVASTDLMPNQIHAISTSDDAVVEDVWNKVNGAHIPFIFSCDQDALGDNAESEHIFARFKQSSLSMSQVAYKLWSFNLKIEEEF